MACAPWTCCALAPDVVTRLIGVRVHSAFGQTARALTLMAENAAAIAVIVASGSPLASAALRGFAKLEGVNIRLALCEAGGALAEETENTFTVVVRCTCRAVLADAPIFGACLPTSHASFASADAAVALPLVANGFPVAIGVGFAHGCGEPAKAAACVQGRAALR